MPVLSEASDLGPRASPKNIELNFYARVRDIYTFLNNYITKRTMVDHWLTGSYYKK